MGPILLPVNVALVVPVNMLPLLDDTDFKTLETAVPYNAAGMSLQWNFVVPGSAPTVTAVVPTTAGVYDWAHLGGAMYSIEIPASGGGSINNNAVGYGWFTGRADGVLPFRSPLFQIGIANIVNALALGTEFLEVTGLKPDFDTAGAVLTVKKRDEATTQFTKTLTTTPGADPITGAT